VAADLNPSQVDAKSGSESSFTTNGDTPPPASFELQDTAATGSQASASQLPSTNETVAKPESVVKNELKTQTPKLAQLPGIMPQDGAALKPPIAGQPAPSATPVQEAQANPIKMRESLDVQSSPEGVKSVDDLTREILRAEIELEKFNLHYKLEATKQGRWKGWRYFAFIESNTAMTLSSLIISVAERGEHLKGDEFTHNSTSLLAEGNVVGAVGQIIGAAGSGLEFLINEYHAIDASRHGFSPNKSRNYVVGLVAEIDKKIAQREVLCKQGAISGDFAEMARREGTVLADFRDLSVSEFERFHIGARKTFAQQQTFYFLDMSQRVTGAVGNFLARKAIYSHDRHFNASAGICTAISGGMIMADPILSRLAGKMVASADKRSLERSGLPQLSEKCDRMMTDYQSLHTYCDQHKEMPPSYINGALARMEAYDCNQSYFTDQLEKSSKELRHGNRIAVQNIGSGMFVGATKVAAGTTLADAGFVYYNSGKETNRLIFAGNVPYLVGTSYGLLDTARIQVFNEVNRQKLSKKKELPGQLIHARLDRLEQIEKKL